MKEFKNVTIVKKQMYILMEKLLVGQLFLKMVKEKR
ncbi:hypothetical protein DFH84_001632 [Clostridium saccharobutylicum]|nr:hypothetical protein [Clostridium saccharobutylicum]